MTKLTNLDLVLGDISCDNFEKQLFGFCPALKYICIHTKKRLPTLNVFPKITSLTLDGAVVDDTVSTGLTNSITLKSLKFTECKIVIDRQDVLTENSTLGNFTSTAIAEELHYNTQIELLKLRNISDSKALNILMFQLIQNKSVSSLEMDSVKLDVEGGRTLRDILRENTTLRKMKISYSIVSIDVAQQLAEGLQYNTGLESLQLFWISDSKALNILMFQLIQNKSLSSLELNYVNLDVKGGRILRDIMRENNTLRNMKLYKSIDSIDVAQRLADGLQYNTGLHTLYLHDIYGSGVMKILIEGLSCNNTIQTLMLYWNSMTIEDYQLLNNSILKKNQTLKNIIIEIRTYHDHLTEELSDGLSVNIGLKNIVIYSSDLSCDDAKMLADSVMKNMNNIIHITLPEKHSQDLSVYSYPKDRVKYMSHDEGM